MKHIVTILFMLISTVLSAAYYPYSFQNEWKKLSQKSGCIGAKILTEPDWQNFFDTVKREPYKFEFLIPLFASAEKTQIHICNWENASGGVLAAMAAERITGHSFLEYDGKNQDVISFVKAAKNSFPQHSALKQLLKNETYRQELQNFYRRAYYGKSMKTLPQKDLIRIAEKELVKIYGERVLQQRPWIVDDENDFTVTFKGTFHHKDRLGGTAWIMLKKDNGKVLYVTHGK